MIPITVIIAYLGNPLYWPQWGDRVFYQDVLPDGTGVGYLAGGGWRFIPYNLGSLP